MTFFDAVMKLIEDGHGLTVVLLAFAPVVLVVVVCETLLRLKGKKE